MKPVFADTSYYVALLSSTNAHHAVAVQWSERLLGRVAVTEYVLIELGSARHFQQAGFRPLLRLEPGRL